MPINTFEPPPPAATSPSLGLLVALSSLAVGLAAAGLGWWAVAPLLAPRAVPGANFERDRLERLRAGRLAFRLFEPLILRLADWFGRSPARLEPLRRNLVIAAWPQPWTAAEYLAVRWLEALAAGAAGAVFGWLLLGGPGGALIFGPLAAWGYNRLMVRAVADRGQRRLAALKRRLPFAIDLMALMIEAGSGFQESLETAVRESRGTPLGEEFGRVLQEIRLGKPRREALESLRLRLRDDDLSELILAIIQGDELGTPLSQIFREQARRMLTKHSLWIERASAEAQVLIVFPGMIIMVACLLIVVSPFLLSALSAR